MERGCWLYEEDYGRELGRGVISNIFGVVYQKVRGHSLGETKLPTSILFSFTSKKMVELVRGTLLRISYGTAVGLHFRGAGTSVTNAKFFHIGDGVAIGRHVSIDAYGTEGIRLGSRVTVGSGSNLVATAVIREPGVGISVGDGTSIGQFNIIWGQGGVSIGANCLLGPRVTVLSENHAFASTVIPIKSQGNVRSEVRIEDDCWIGAGATILAGVTIGHGSIVAAGAVVTKDCQPFSILGGVPAKLLRSREIVTNSHHSGSND